MVDFATKADKEHRNTSVECQSSTACQTKKPKEREGEMAIRTSTTLETVTLPVSNPFPACLGLENHLQVTKPPSENLH